MDVYKLSIRFHVGKRRQEREDRVATAGESRYATFHVRASPTMSVSSPSSLSRALTPATKLFCPPAWSKAIGAERKLP
jgi:hypothetical protein